MSEVLRYVVIIERTEDGFSAFVPDLPGCITAGDTLIETEQNMREAILGHIAVMKEFGEIIPRPTTFTEYIEVPAEVPAAVGQ